MHGGMTSRGAHGGLPMMLGESGGSQASGGETMTRGVVELWYLHSIVKLTPRKASLRTSALASSASVSILRQRTTRLSLSHIMATIFRRFARPALLWPSLRVSRRSISSQFGFPLHGNAHCQDQQAPRALSLPIPYVTETTVSNLVLVIRAILTL